MKSFPLFQESECIDNMPSHGSFKSIWLSNLSDNYTDSDGWDYQYSYLNMINNRLSIIPNKNLISNIGCNNSATHYTQNHPLADILLEELDEVIPPALFITNSEADIYTQELEYQVLTSREESMKGFQFLKNKLSELATQVDNLHKIPKIIH